MPWIALPTHSASIAGLQAQTDSGVLTDSESFTGEVARCFEPLPNARMSDAKRDELLALSGLNASGD